MSTILVVGSDRSIKSVLKDCLRHLGGELHWVSTAEEAIQSLANCDCHLLIAEHELPDGESGLLLWQYCQSKFPSIPFLLVCGVHSDLFEDLVTMGVACPPFLAKPFSVEEFQQIVTPVMQPSTYGFLGSAQDVKYDKNRYQNTH